jgi:hypothetical protein
MARLGPRRRVSIVAPRRFHADVGDAREEGVAMPLVAVQPGGEAEDGAEEEEGAEDGASHAISF